MGVDVDHDMVGARGDRCNQGTFDDLMGRMFEEKAVFEGAGFVLVAVADNELVALLMRRDHVSLSVWRETRSAHAAQVGRGNHCGNPVRVLKRVAKSDAAAGGQPCTEVRA